MSDFNSQHNRVVWFDLPVADLGRAQAFYQSVLGIPVRREKFQDFDFCVLEHHDGNGGCLVIDPGKVSAGGILVYMNVDGRIRDAVVNVGRHGGKVLEDVHGIGPHGVRAIVLDSEGNRIALHSGSDA
jgi:predicted enzyme related to lactoylglutathione lyase